jgi:hypothetical protein
MKKVLLFFFLFFFSVTTLAQLTPAPEQVPTAPGPSVTPPAPPPITPPPSAAIASCGNTGRTGWILLFLCSN